MRKLFYLIPLVLAAVTSCKGGGSLAEEDVPEIIFGSIDYEAYFQDEVGYKSSCNLAYVVSDGFQALKDSLDALNHRELGALQQKAETGFMFSEEEMDEYMINTLPWSEDSFMTINSSSPKLLSLTYSFESWMGGAHPNSDLVFLNYDVKTGQKVALRDVVNDYDAFYNKVVEDLEALNNSEEYDDIFFEEWKATVDAEFNGDAGQPNWAIDSKGLCIFFNRYEIAPYVAGPIELEYTFEEHPDIVKKEFIPVEKEPKLIDLGASDVFGEIFERFAKEVDNYNYDQCVTWFEGKGYDCEFEAPYEDESNGCITVKDANGCRIVLEFWPKGDEPANLNSVEYKNDDCNLISGHNYSDEEIRFSIIDYTINTRIYFTSLDDAEKVFFKYYLK